MVDFIAKTIVTQAVEELNETTVKNETVKQPSTPEGMAVAYGSLVIMALLPIFFGSYRSVNYHKEKVRDCRGDDPYVNERLTVWNLKLDSIIATSLTYLSIYGYRNRRR